MEPYRTVEVRWFVAGAVPAAVRAWFDGLGPTVAPESRADRYLAPASDALGVKLREGQAEAKRRDAVLGPLAGLLAEGADASAGWARAEVEAWAKWSFTLADGVPEPADGWVAVGKTRWQHHAGDCALELSEVAVAGDAWWSVCLEATGPTADARRAALADGARLWLAADAPALDPADARGYPAWLRSMNSTL